VDETLIKCVSRWVDTLVDASLTLRLHAANHRWCGVWDGLCATGEHMDARYGRYVNANLGEYHVPVNADIPNMIVEFVPEEDRTSMRWVSRASVRLRWSEWRRRLQMRSITPRASVSAI